VEKKKSVSKDLILINSKVEETSWWLQRGTFMKNVKTVAWIQRFIHILEK